MQKFWNCRNSENPWETAHWAQKSGTYYDNWFDDPAQLVQSLLLPVAGDSIVFQDSNYSPIDGPAEPIAFLNVTSASCNVPVNVNVTGALVMQGMGAFFGDASAATSVLFDYAATNNGVVGDGSVFTSQASNRGTVGNNAQFRYSSWNAGTVGTGAVFMDQASNGGVWIGGYMNQTSYASGICGANAQFQDESCWIAGACGTGVIWNSTGHIGNEMYQSGANVLLGGDVTVTSKGTFTLSTIPMRVDGYYGTSNFVFTHKVNVSLYGGLSVLDFSTVPNGSSAGIRRIGP